MPETTYPIPVGIRLTDDAKKDIRRIIAFHSVPGMKIDRSKAVMIALAAYASTLPEVEGNDDVLEMAD